MIAQDNNNNEHIIELAEKIIGGFLIDPNAIERLDDLILEEHVPLDCQKKVLRVCKDLFKRGVPVDLMSVSTELDIRKELERVGGLRYLANLAERTVSAVNIDQYFYMLIEEIENYSQDGKMRPSKALELIKEYYISDRTEEQLVLDLEELREKVEMPHYKWDKFIAATIRRAKKDRYRLELKRLIEIEDPLDQSIEIDEVCEIYRKSRKTVEKDIAKIESQTYTQVNACQPKLAIAYDQVEVAPIPYLIPDFIPGGSSILLSGVSGTAKTQFMLDVADSLLEGTEFLGLKPTKKCKVLLLITDQSARQSMSYMRNKGMDFSNPNFALWLKDGDDPGFTVHDLLKLRKFIEDFRPDFIAADSLRTIICHPTGVSENDIEVGAYLNKLIQEATRFGSTFMLIHHENKSGDFRGVSKSSGSGDIPARFDVHWRLEKPMETSEVRNFLTAKTRSVSRNGRLNLNLDECRFELERWEMESPEFSQALSSAINRIDHLLTLNPNGLAIWDIEEMLARAGTPVSTRTVRRCLAQMTASQSIGRKQHPTRQKAFLYFKSEIFSSGSGESASKEEPKISETLIDKGDQEMKATVTIDVNPLDDIEEPLPVNQEMTQQRHRPKNQTGKGFGASVQRDRRHSSDSQKKNKLGDRDQQHSKGLKDDDQES